MTIFIFHFECQPRGKVAGAQHWSAESCSISDSIEEAESQARDLITTHAYTAGALIAFARVEPSQIAHLSQDEATLYLKAQQHTPPCAVLFSAVNDHPLPR